MADPAAIEQLAAQAMASQTLPIDTSQLLNPIIEAVKPVMGIISALVGGLFGLYLLFILSRLYYEHKKVKLLKDMRYDLDYLNQHFGLPYSKEKGIRKKIMPLAEMEKIRKEKEEKQKNKEKENAEKEKEKEKKNEEKNKQKEQAKENKKKLKEEKKKAKEEKKAEKERKKKEIEEEEEIAERKETMGKEEDKELRL